MSKWPGNSVLPVLSNKFICGCFLYLGYSSRFSSVYLIVIFTIERFIGVCRPLYRKCMCTDRVARRSIGCCIMMSYLLTLYKPITGGVVPIGNDQYTCGALPTHKVLNFVLDTIYALLITIIPFCIIFALNMMIIRRLIATKRRHNKARFTSEENMIKLEFTLLLLLVSTSFVALNVPYFIVWCLRISNHFQRVFHAANPSDLTLRGAFFITKAIFSVNYCVNFFAYAITGARFRRQLGLLLKRTGFTSMTNLVTEPPEFECRKRSSSTMTTLLTSSISTGHAHGPRMSFLMAREEQV